jgi:hypothetical protein
LWPPEGSDSIATLADIFPGGGHYPEYLLTKIWKHFMNSPWHNEVLVLQAAEKVPLIVIPNEVRNLSGFECPGKEGFLGTQRASE